MAAPYTARAQWRYASMHLACDDDWDAGSRLAGPQRWRTCFASPRSGSPYGIPSQQQFPHFAIQERLDRPRIAFGAEF